jgi:hypothetical protein
MKNLLIVFCLVSLFACDKAFVANTLESKVIGDFSTNAVLDAACFILPADKMPSTSIKKLNENEVSITITRYLYKNNEYEKVVSEYKPIVLSEDSRGVAMSFKDKEFGYFGMPSTYTGPKTKPILWIKYIEQNSFVYFVGEKK